VILAMLIDELRLESTSPFALTYAQIRRPTGRFAVREETKTHRAHKTGVAPRSPGQIVSAEDALSGSRRHESAIRWGRIVE
jgi:hypothetical protein